MGMKPRTLIEAVKHFASFDNCKEFMVARRWPNGVTCPTCGSDAVYWDSSRKGWECKTRHEKRKFTLKTGTIFEDSPIGLDKWLPVVWMIANAKNGISSHEISRAIGVTQKTAWFMLHRIRLAMQDETTGGKLGGDVEVDETYIGGAARNMHKDRKKRALKYGRSGKTAVMGLLERHDEKGMSRIRTAVVPSNRWEPLQAGVRRYVEPGATVYTDALASYRGLGPGYGGEYAHRVIDHAEAYVDGQVHTNGLENFWSLLKRGLRGTYVAVEPFHLFRYVDEQAFRFNQRKATDSDRFGWVIDAIVGRRLTYAELIAALGARQPA
jgi:transposase-like protein